MKSKIRAFARKTGVVLMTCLMLTSGIPNQLLAQAAEATVAAQQDTGADAAGGELASHALTYDGNGATAGSMDPTVYGSDGGATVKVAANAFEREGYTFTGWSTTATGEDLKDGDGKVSMRAVFIPAETELDNLTFSWDENGDGKIADDERLDASDCERDNYLTLYAQWEQDATDENHHGDGTAAVVGSDSDEPLTQDDLKDAEMIDAPELTREQLNALVDDPAGEPKAEGKDDNPEGDGTSIGQVKVSWITKSTPEGSNDPTLTVTPGNDDAQIIRMRLSASFSGQHDYNVGDIQFTVPKHVVKDRDGANIGTMTLGVPEAPDSNAIFAYTDMGDYIVVTNVRKLSAATSVFVEFSVKNLKPHEIDGNLDHYESGDVKNEFYATAQVVTYKGNVLTRSSNTIDVRFDTQEKVGAAYDKVVGLSEAWDDSWPAELKPENDADYVYVEWYSWTSVSGNQDYGMTARHTLSDKFGGVVLGAKDQKGNVTKGDGGTSIDLTLREKGYTTSGLQDYMVHVYAAYPKDKVPAVNDAHYTFKDKVTYTLTSTDDKKVTTSSDDATKVYSPIKFKDPQGHFNVFKYGNRTYAAALDKLRKGQDVELEYDVETLGFIAPWTWPADKDGEHTAETKGTKSVTMVTDDYSTQFNHSDTDLTSADFEFASIDVERPHTYEYKKYEKPGYGYIESPSSGGTAVSWGYIGAGDFGYATVDDPARTPDVEVWGSIDGGESELLGVVSWKSGSAQLSRPRQGVTVGTSSRSGAMRLSFAADLNVTDVTTKITSNEGAHIYTTNPVVRLKATDAIKKQVEELFENSDSPDTILRNRAVMNAYETDGNKHIVTCGPKAADDRLQGTTITASASKTVSIQNDTSNRQVKLRYRATVTERSNIKNRADYDAAVEDGIIVPETSGTWYDLLPVGVVPDLSTLAGRKGDTITSVRLIEDYKGSGRTMMVVQMRLTPSVDYAAGEDIPSISFDATYLWESMVDYGVDLENVIAFESGNDQLGNVKGLMGEPNDPTKGNNVGSASATKGVEELMSNLAVPGEDARHTNSFVYARAAEKLAVDTSAVASLSKRVAANGSGIYKTGLASDAVNVYEGGSYTYRLRYESEEGTTSKGMVFYDALESYDPKNYNDDSRQDIGDKTWRGTLLSVDTSQMESAGAKPVVYYNTRIGLVLDDADDQGDLELTKENGWTTERPADASTITAIAIDASKAKDGGEFKLPAGKSLVATLRMKAPTASDLAAAANDGHEAGDWYDTQIGDEEKESENQGYHGGAHAYNNVSIKHTKTSDALIGGTSVTELIHQDYTKVGLLPFSIKVHKAWDDDDNRDGARPESVEVELCEDGVPTDKTAVLSDENNWEATFEGLTPVTETGAQRFFTVREVGDTNGYVGFTSQKQTDQGIELTLTNYREPEKISVSGTKVWDDENDAAGKRPTSIKLDLYANGEFLKSKTVYANGQGGSNEWDYTFDGLYKYENGKEIEYEVREEVYYEGYDAPVFDGSTITNTYDPYGNLRIEKEVEDATEASKNASFTFRVDIADKEGDADSGTYTYTKSDGTTGSISTGGTLTLQGGQSATIAGIPSESTYTVSEEAASGFTQTSVSGATGTIRAGETRTAKASFTNTYSASGQIRLTAKKVLTGRDLAPYQFKFELVDEATGQVVRTANNAADGTVTFGVLRYTLGDIGDHSYIIREVEPTASGYEEWDQHEEKVTVTVADTKGIGELDVTASYTGHEGGSAEDAVFTNNYHAKGSVNLRAWKTLTGRELQGDEFSFKLTANGDAPKPEGADADGSVTVKNDANGIIDFPKIDFTEENVGGEYTYTAEEVPGEDPTVAYTGKKITYTVKVVDNGDGTLSFDQTVDTDTKDDTAAVFKNALKPGNLEIQKLVGQSEGDPSDPNQEFTFHVQLTAKDGQELPGDGGYSYELKQLTAPTAGEPESVAAAEDEADEPETDAAGAPATVEAKAVADEAVANAAVPAPVSVTPKAGTLPGGGVPWRLDANGVLTIGNGSSGTWVRTATNAGSDPWYSDRASITSIKVNGSIELQGQGGKSPSLAYLCGDMSSLKEVDLKGLSANDVTDMSCMFYGCSSLKSLDLSGLDTSKVTNMNNMFSGCSSLTSLDLSRLHTSSATGMSYMFSGCSSLESLDLSGLDTSKVTGMAGMFSGCSSLESLDLSSLVTSSVTDMYEMFSGCSSLKSLDLSHLRTSSVTNMYEMFSYCSSLASLKLSGLVTSSATNMSYMFSHCSSLTSLDLSSFDASKKTSVKSMFSNCSSLSSLTLGKGFKSLSGSSLPNSPTPTYTGKWVPKDGGQPYTASGLMNQWDPETMAGTWVWEKAPTDYTVAYDPNGGAGNMANQKWELKTPGMLARNTFYYFGYDFSGWATIADGPAVYQDGDTVSDDFGGKAQAGGTVNLYATWAKRSTDVTIKDGGFDIKLRANEAALFKNLPANIGYTVTELTPAGWKLVASSGTSGTIPAQDIATATFRNAYEPEATTVDAKVVATKTLDGQAPADGQFQFTLAPTGATTGETQTTSANAAGGVEFNLTGLKEGEYTYTLKEETKADDNIQYDTTSYAVTVKVAKNADGMLQATVTYNDGSTSPIFKNTTKEKPEGSLTLKKVVSGKDAQDYQDKTFRFRIDWNGGLEHEVVALNSENGFTWTKDKIPAGTTYAVTETDIPDGYALEGITAESGTIESGQTVEVTATNKYAATGSAIIQAKKVLEGGVLASGQFAFGLFKEGDPADAEPIAQATNSADGDVVFDALEYTQADVGAHTYEVREIAGTDTGITYDNSVGKATVTATDDGNGHLSTEVSYEGGEMKTFTNKVNPGDLIIAKHVVNAPGKGDREFSFTLALTKADGSPLTEDCHYTVLDASDKEVGTGSVKDGGTIKLKDGQKARVQVPLGVAYTVTEQDAPGYTGEVTSGAPTGTIQQGEGQNAVEFTNTYAASGAFVVAATKHFNGGVLEDGQFTFKLTTVKAPGREDEVGQELTATNDADGKIAFSGLVYSDADAGKTFVYELSEESGAESNIVYDKTKVTVSVTPVDNGDGTMTVKATYADSSAEGSGGSEVGSGESGWTFTNVRTFLLPETGQAGVALAIAGGLALVAASGAWVVKRRRRRA